MMELGNAIGKEVSNKELASNHLDGFGIDPDKLIEPKSGENLESPGKKPFDPDQLIESASLDASGESEPLRNNEVGEARLYTSREERIDQTPRNNGEWTGDRGDSKFVHEDEGVRKALKEYGIDGIEYKDGVVDFSPISAHSVDIDMTSRRYGPGGNFEKADTQAAKDWNAEAREGRTDWKPRDVEEWREKNGYTWHECSDQRTCELVPRDLHAAFGHAGGVLECKRRDNGGNGGGFDD